MSSTRSSHSSRADVKCLGRFTLEDLANLKSRTGCFLYLVREREQANLKRSRNWPIVTMPNNHLIPTMILSHSPEN